MIVDEHKESIFAKQLSYLLYKLIVNYNKGTVNEIMKDFVNVKNGDYYKGEFREFVRLGNVLLER